jgi:hypothetical protein
MKMGQMSHHDTDKHENKLISEEWEQSMSLPLDMDGNKQISVYEIRYHFFSLISVSIWTQANNK